jgi:UDP-glucose 4-epimerase
LKENKGVHTFNLGSGEGFTNKEIVEAFKTYTGEEFVWEYGPKRPGDPGRLRADNTRFIDETGFKYTHTDLEKIITSAWDWYKKSRMRNI